MAKKTIKIVCILLFVLLFFYTLFFYPEKLSSIIESHDNAYMMRIVQDGTYENIDISENCEINLANMIDKLWCRKSEKITNFLAPGDLCLFYGQWCIVFTEKKSYLYSVSRNDYYQIIGNPKDLYCDVQSKIQ